MINASSKPYYLQNLRENAYYFKNRHFYTTIGALGYIGIFIYNLTLNSSYGFRHMDFVLRIAEFDNDISIAT